VTHQRDFESFDAITFDCYGTLIDWEQGILTALTSLLREATASPSPEELLAMYGRLEAQAERGPHRRYRVVLEAVARAFGRELDVEVGDAAAAAFAASVAEWPPFPDSAQGLAALGSQYRLAIVSNVDDDLFAGSALQLGANFTEVVTAEQVESYKPRAAHFHEVVRRLGLPKERILHVAGSLYHDIAPAKALGFTCVWVNRRAGKLGGGATLPSEAEPDLEVPDLRSLVEAMGL